MLPDHPDRLALARLSLAGLSVGDALGEMLSASVYSARAKLAAEALPPGPWWFTDDTEMALGIYDTLAALGQIDPDHLAERFVARFERDRLRAYGGGARRLLNALAAGSDWRFEAPMLFHGGSMGNGGAMRAAPLGAYFFDDLDACAANAEQSAIVTHAHAEGIAGATAVAAAAAAARATRDMELPDAQQAILRAALDHAGAETVRDGIAKVIDMGLDAPRDRIVGQVGNGFQVTAPDTVPFAIWAAARHLGDFREAIAFTIEADGDCDTNAAIVGGIVALRGGIEAIPERWRESVEPLGLPEA